MSEHADLREAVAAEHGLDPRAARFLVGSTIEQLEQSAAALATLLEVRKPDPASDPPADPFTGAAEMKAARKVALANALTGRAQEQPRDAQGRFTSGGFDGGARQPVPQPPEDHDAWLSRVIRERHADAGARF